MALNDEDGGFVIFSGKKLWYASKEGLENTICKPKTNRVANKVRNSAKNRRIVEYPIFDQIMLKETDTFWVSFFDDAAVGKFPRNFKYDNGCLVYRVKSKNIEIKIPDDPELAVMEIKRFLLDQAGIQSPDDIVFKKKMEEQRISQLLQNEITDWSHIRGEKQQTTMISIFVEKIGSYYKLNLEERKGLMQKIKLGIFAGYFNNENIQMGGNQIVNIIGLDFDEDCKEFSIQRNDLYMTKINKKMIADTTLSSSYEIQDNVNVNKKSLLKNWQKYLKEVYKA